MRRGHAFGEKRLEERSNFAWQGVNCSAPRKRTASRSMRDIKSSLCSGSRLLGDRSDRRKGLSQTGSRVDVAKGQCFPGSQLQRYDRLHGFMLSKTGESGGLR